jgi:hypothetical protein
MTSDGKSSSGMTRIFGESWGDVIVGGVVRNGASSGEIAWGSLASAGAT